MCPEILILNMVLIFQSCSNLIDPDCTVAGKKVRRNSRYELLNSPSCSTGKFVVQREKMSRLDKAKMKISKIPKKKT